MEVTITIKLSHEQLIAIWDAGIEYASTYWLSICNSQTDDDGNPSFVIDDHSEHMMDCVADPDYMKHLGEVITLDTIVKGIQKMSDQGYKLTLQDCEIEADIILQYGIFGEALYG